MRIRSVTAHAFGPLRSETLTFADGMTVIIGDNESAKSSWHAAIFAALCGRRRARGRRREDDQRFAELHQPWDADDWLVTADVELDDGRHIELRQDLAGGVDCHAWDLQLNRDVSEEVMNEGTPDASRWLGLDRNSFTATACVEQAQLLRVLGAADGLQEHLQRAAATAGQEETAAAALERLEAFQREHVGLDRASATRPLRRALDEVGATERRLAAAKDDHHEYLERLAEVDELRQQAEGAADRVRHYEAAAATDRARRLADRRRIAVALHERYGETAPATVAGEEELALRVTSALTEWEARPQEAVPPPRSSAEVQQELDALPSIPEGDLEVNPEVEETLAVARERQAALDGHLRERPEVPSSPTPVAASDNELLQHAQTLDSPVPEVDGRLALAESEARAAVSGAEAGGRRAVRLIVAAVVVALIGAGAIVGIDAVAGAPLLVVAAILAAVALWMRHPERLRTARRALADAQVALATEQRRVQDLKERWEKALARCEELGVVPDPVVLRGIPAERARAAGHAAQVERWQASRQERERELEHALRALAKALSARREHVAAVDFDSLVTAVNGYREACRERAAVAVMAARRAVLTTELEACRQAEGHAERARQARERAAAAVLAAARACKLDGESADACAAALQQWARDRGDVLGRLAGAQQEWAELKALLGGGTIAELQEEANEAEGVAERLRSGLSPIELDGIEGAQADAELPRLREEAATRAERAAASEGELRSFAEKIPSVSEAEEAHAAAVEELQQVRELQETLELTRRFLVSAQTRVHRDIAPVLADTVRRWLPSVTAGRYQDVTVDPTTLKVSVCGPTRRWRDAARLSYGTAEQIYLLLRVALADHLTKGNDTCPLLLDDVTVHADSARTVDVLRLLLEIANHRQVVLFSQEQQVADWAREHLVGERDAMHILTPVASV